MTEYCVPLPIPTRKFRTIRSAVANYKTAYYATKSSRDSAAQRDADRDRAAVTIELWSPEHPQDDLNRGWACDGWVSPRG